MSKKKQCGDWTVHVIVQHTTECYKTESSLTGAACQYITYHRQNVVCDRSVHINITNSYYGYHDNNISYVVTTNFLFKCSVLTEVHHYLNFSSRVSLMLIPGTG
jgi:hypothetical protein